MIEKETSMKDLFALCQRKMNDCRKLEVIINDQLLLNNIGQFMDRNGEQMCVLTPRQGKDHGKYYYFKFLDGKNRKTYWVSKDGHGTLSDINERHLAEPAPVEQIVTFLSAALPLPAPQSMYGEIGVGKRIVSLHYFGYRNESSMEISYDGYSLDGTTIPRCSQKHASGKHYRINLPVFWQCVQGGKIININKTVKRSNRPTLSVWCGEARFILTDAEWTGVKSEALYRHLGFRDEQATVEVVRTGESRDLRKQGLKG